MKDLSKDFKKAKESHKMIQQITEMLGGMDSSFKLLGINMRLRNRLQDLMDLKDIIDNKETTKKLINIMEQFEKIVDDFIKENNISEDNLLSEYMEEREGTEDE